MGYHILIPKNNIDDCIYYFVNDIRELAYIDDITKDTIIYEGEESQQPRRLATHEDFKKYVNLHYRVGTRAEDLFKDQAKENEFTLLDIPQNQKDFEQYKTYDKRVKRGDFIVRNASVEVDVKCKTIYGSRKEDKYFCLNVDDLKKHLNMMEFTGTPVVIAVYARNDDDPDPDELYMIEIEKIWDNLDSLSMGEAYNQCYKIPLGLTEKGFELLERLRRK